MMTEIIESKFQSGIHICFNNLGYIDDFDTIADVIDNNISVELIENVDAIWSRYRTYKSDDQIFQLMYHEEIGNCLRLPLKRDHRYDKEGYELLRKIGNQIVKILNSKTK